MQFLKVYQIYFKDEQFSLLEPEYTPILNSDCTPYFESSVICNLPIVDCEYFGVVSYKLREKIGSVMKERWKSLPNIANHSLQEFTPLLFEQELRRSLPDVMSFQRHLPHDPILVAERFHPEFRKHWEFIMNEIGFPWEPTRFENVFYCNYFVARADIYRDFVETMLKPAIKVMGMIPELWQDSKYPRVLPEELQKKWGIKWYPFHAFLAERMFSWYAYKKNLNCLHY